MKCEGCQSKLERGALFCTVCGTKAPTGDVSQEPSSTPDKKSSSQANLTAKVDETLTSAKVVFSKESIAEKSAATKASVSAAWDKFRAPENKKQRIFAGIGAVVVIVLIALSVVSAQVAQMNEQERLRLAAQNLEQAFGQAVLEKYEPSCADANKAVTTSVDLNKAASQLAVARSTTNARQAKAAVSANGLSTTTYATKYKAAIESALSPGFKLLMSSEKRASSALEDQKSRWEAEWPTVVLTKCNLATVYATNVSNLTATDSAVSSFLSLAASAPWYPEGFYISPSDTDIAYRWDDAGANPGCYSCSYWRMTVVANTKCTSVYGEISISVNGTAVTWTNDTLSGLSAYQQGSLVYKTYNTAVTRNTSAASGKLVTLNCH